MKNIICKRASKNFEKFLSNEKHSQILEKIIWKQAGNKLSKKYGNKVREILFSLQNNKKIRAQVSKGEISLKRLTTLSTEEFASSELAKKRKKIQQEQLEQQIIERKHFLGNRGDFSVLLSERQNIVNEDISENQRKVDILDISLKNYIKSKYHKEKILEYEDFNKKYLSILKEESEEKINLSSTNTQLPHIDYKLYNKILYNEKMCKDSKVEKKTCTHLQLTSQVKIKNLEWHGIVKDSFLKKRMKISIKYFAGKKINLTNLFPKIMGSNGRIRYSNLQQVLPMLKNIGPYKSHMLCKINCIDRSHKEDYITIFENYQKNQRGIVIDLKKKYSFKLYILPPCTFGKMIRNIWGVNPLKNQPWGYIIYYHHN